MEKKTKQNKKVSTQVLLFGYMSNIIVVMTHATSKCRVCRVKLRFNQMKWMRKKLEWFLHVQE